MTTTRTTTTTEPPESGGTQGDGARGLARLAAAGLVAAVVVLFGAGLAGGFVSDDHLLIEARSGEGLRQALGSFWASWQVRQGATAGAFYRPLVNLWFAVGRGVGLGPAGFHAASLAVHALAAVLGFAWLRRRLGGGRGATIAAALASLAVAVHPTRPESVTFVSGCTDLFMAALCLAALEAWDRGRTLLAALAALGALACKETAVVLPVLLAADVALRGAPAAAGRTGRRAWEEVAQVALVVLGAAMVRFVAFGAAASRPPPTDDPVLLRVLSSLGHLVQSVVWPWAPTFFLAPFEAYRGYPYTATSLALGGAAVSAAVALFVLGFRHPGVRPWLADALWFLLPLAPAVNLVPLNYDVLVAERFLYLPLFGAAALLSRALLPAVSGTRAARAAAVAAVAAWSLATGAVTARRVLDFRSDGALYQRELELHPVAPDVLQARSRAARSEGDLPGALRFCVQAQRHMQSNKLILELAVECADSAVDLIPASDRASLEALDAFLAGLAAPPAERVLRISLAGEPEIQVRTTDKTADLLRANPRYAAVRARLRERLGPR